MTVRTLIDRLEDLIKHGLKESDIVKVFDGDTAQLEPITGILYGGSDNVVELCTDDTD